MKALIIFLCLSCFSHLSAQSITMEPDQFTFNSGDANELGGMRTEYLIKNISDMPIHWAWTMEKDENIPDEWDIYMCDMVICPWDKNDLDMPSIALNYLAPGDSTDVLMTAIQVVTNGVEGMGSIQLCIYENHNYDAEPLLCSEFTTSTLELNDKKNSFYPNPANDRFQLNGNDKIDILELYTITGQKIAQFEYAKGRNYNIINIPKGFYMLNVRDKEDNLIETIKLFKQ